MGAMEAIIDTLPLFVVTGLAAKTAKSSLGPLRAQHKHRKFKDLWY